MSNCISFLGSKSSFMVDNAHIDLEGLQALIDRVQNLPKAPDAGADPDGYIAWWFLSYPGGDVRPVQRYSGHTLITFGVSRSTHTWRDWRSTLLLLARYIRRPLKKSFVLKDDDAPTDWGRVELWIGGNELVCEDLGWVHRRGTSSL